VHQTTQQSLDDSAFYPQWDGKNQYQLLAEKYKMAMVSTDVNGLQMESDSNHQVSWLSLMVST